MNHSISFFSYCDVGNATRGYGTRIPLYPIIVIRVYSVSALPLMGRKPVFRVEIQHPSSRAVSVVVMRLIPDVFFDTINDPHDPEEVGAGSCCRICACLAKLREVLSTVSSSPQCDRIRVQTPSCLVCKRQPLLEERVDDARQAKLKVYHKIQTTGERMVTMMVAS